MGPQENNYQQIIDDCNEECRRCRADYEKAEIDFDHHVCTMCKNGQKLHETLIKANPGEKAWGDQDWNSFRLKGFYHG